MTHFLACLGAFEVPKERCFVNQSKVVILSHTPMPAHPKWSYRSCSLSIGGLNTPGVHVLSDLIGGGFQSNPVRSWWFHRANRAGHCLSSSSQCFGRSARLIQNADGAFFGFSDGERRVDLANILEDIWNQPFLEVSMSETCAIVSSS